MIDIPEWVNMSKVACLINPKEKYQSNAQLFILFTLYDINNAIGLFDLDAKISFAIIQSH